MDHSPEVLVCSAPAKLNLFLHVVGRRADGYHLIESVFQLVDLADTVRLELRDDACISRGAALEGVTEDADLTLRAARVLQVHTGSRLGVEISIEKRIPVGGGLGGGSSDAATTLLALNRMWKLGLTRAELMSLGLALGADVPFFIFGTSAFVRGIGEQMSAVATPERCFAIIHPGVSVPTAAIFAAPELTRDTESLRIPDFSERFQYLADGSRSDYRNDRPGNSDPVFHNDLEPVAAARFPEVGRALSWLRRLETAPGAAAMSGSGACVFCPVADAAAANAALRNLPHGWSGWVAKSLAAHPLRSFADD